MRCHFDVSRRGAANQSGRQTTGDIYPAAIQTMRIRGEQMGPNGGTHAHRALGQLYPRHVPNHGSLPNCFYHWSNR